MTAQIRHGAPTVRAAHALDREPSDEPIFTALTLALMVLVVGVVLVCLVVMGNAGVAFLDALTGVTSR